MSDDQTPNNEADEELNLEEELEKEEAKANAEAANETPSSEGGEETPESESAPEKQSQQPKKENENEDLNETELSQLSAKAQKRYKYLSERAKKADELEKQAVGTQTPKPAPRIPDLVNRPLRPTPPSVAKGKLPWEVDKSEDGQEQEEETLTTEQLDERTRQVVQEENRKTEILANLKTDVKSVEDKYSLLNADSDEYDEGLSNWLADQYQTLFEAHWAKGKVLRFTDFVDQVMSLREKGVEQGKTQVTTKVAEQAAEQAVSPAGAQSSKGGDATEDRIKSAKTLDELEKAAESLPHA